jgi:hypothetical protein
MEDRRPFRVLVEAAEYLETVGPKLQEKHPMRAARFTAVATRLRGYAAAMEPFYGPDGQWLEP